MTDHSSSIPRRRFLGALALSGAALALPETSLLSATPTSASPHLAPVGPDDWDHSWLKKLSAKHMPFFENKTMGSDTLQYPKRYYDAMLDGYGAAAKDVLIVIGFAGTGWPIALNDEKWAAWGLTAGGNGNPPGRNPVRGTPDDDPNTTTTVATWKKRGAIFLVCNNALRKGATELAAKLPGGDAAKIHAEMRASIIPEFTVVPALVTALALAQEQKCSYLVGS